MPINGTKQKSAIYCPKKSLTFLIRSSSSFLKTTILDDLTPAYTFIIYGTVYGIVVYRIHITAVEDFLGAPRLEQAKLRVWSAVRTIIYCSMRSPGSVNVGNKKLFS